MVSSLNGKTNAHWPSVDIIKVVIRNVIIKISANKQTDKIYI